MFRLSSDLRGEYVPVTDVHSPNVNSCEDAIWPVVALRPIYTYTEQYSKPDGDGAWTLALNVYFVRGSRCFKDWEMVLPRFPTAV
jgi:hypothetical protein